MAGAVMEKLVVRGGVLSTTYLLLNIFIGPGILVISYTLLQAGFGLGVLLVIITHLITAYVLKVLIRAGELSGRRFFYPAIIDAAFGRLGFYTSVIVTFLFVMLVAAALMLIVGESGHKLIGGILGNTDGWYISRQFLTALAVLTIVFPLALKRDLTVLASFSIISVLTMILVIFLAIVRLNTLDLPYSSVDAVTFTSSWRGVINALGILNGVTIHSYAALTFYNAMADRTEKKWEYAVYITTSVSALLFVTLGITGFATFTGHTLPDLADNYCLDDLLFTVARVFILLTMGLTLPLQAFVMRELFEMSVFPRSQPSPQYRHVLVTIVVLVVPYVITLVVPCLGFIGALNGDIGGTTLAIILPVSALLKLQKIPIFCLDNVFPLLVLAYGLAIAVVGTVYDVMEAVEGVHCPDAIIPAYCQANNTGFLNTTTAGP